MKSVIVKRSTIYLVWVIPIIAIIVSGIMLFNEYAKMGETVVIIFKDAQGFKQDETPIKYKGIHIGMVKDIEVDPKDLNKFVITAKIKKSFSKYLTEGARFWKVSPKLKPTEFTGLSTLFSGTYIEFSPATNDPEKLSKLKKKRKFNGFQEEPKTNVTYFKLISEDGSLIEGAPVLFKNFLVGNITKRSLKGKKVEYVISIDNRFANLVKVNSNFWKISPVDIKASFPDFQLKVNNTLNFFFGGIQFDSPDNSPSVCSLNKNSKEFQVCNGKGFYLFPSKSDTEFSLKTIKLVLKNAHKIQSSLKIVYYKGEVAGKVVNAEYDVETDTKYLYVRMKKKYSEFLAYKCLFWIQKPSLENLNIPSIIKGTHIEFAFYNEKSEPKDTYILHHSKPFGKVVRIKLKSEHSAGLSAGDYIFYGKTIIGEITSVSLKENSEYYSAVLYSEYASLLKGKPVFYKKSGFEGSLSSEGLTLKVSPLKQLLLGGVGLLKCECKNSLEKNTYPLFKSRRDAERYIYLNKDGAKFILYAETLKGIYEGMGIYYNGMKIGKVYRVDFDREKNIFKLYSFVEKRFKPLLNQNSLFYKASGIDVKIGLDAVEVKTENLISLLKGAIILKTGKKSSSSNPLKEYKLLSESEFQAKNFVKAVLISDYAYGLKKSSQVRYRGVIVGKVSGLDIENEKVKIHLLIDKKYSYLLTSSTKFYIEKEKFSAGEIKNASASIFGSFIKIAYFPSDKKKSEFVVAGVNPSDTVYLKGLRIILLTDDAETLQKGSPIVFKGVEIGQIESISLSEEKRVKIIGFIKEKFRDLITENSVFEKIKPLSFKVGFVYAKMDFKSLSAMVKGGISLVNVGKGKGVNDFYTFELKEEKK